MAENKQQDLKAVAIPLSNIIFNEANRDANKALQDMADNIKAVGLIHPITVRKINDKYQLVTGERRVRAHLLNKAETIHAFIREMTDAEAIALMISENDNRENMQIHELAGMVYKMKEIDKKITPELMATQLGKSPYFVNQMLKVKSLIKPLFDKWIKGEVSLKAALDLAQLPEDVQKSWIKANNWEMGRYIDNVSHSIRNASRDLNTAPFDKEDVTLSKNGQKCSTCQFNTANQAVLFADQVASPRCTFPENFDFKLKKHMERVVKAAQEDPSIELLNAESYGSSDLVEKLEKNGNKVLSNNDWSIAGKAQRPDWDDYSFPEDGDDDPEDFEYKTEAAAKKQYDADIKAFEEQQQSLDKLVESGKVVKGLIVNGPGMGSTVYINPPRKKQTAAKVKDKVKEGKASAADIGGEIRRIEDNAKRKTEIENEKAYKVIYEALNKDKTYVQQLPKLTHEELVGAVMVVYEKVGHNSPHSIKELSDTSYNTISTFKKLMAMKDAQLEKLLNQSLRMLILDWGSPGQNTKHTHNNSAAVVYAVAEKFQAAGLKKVMAGVKEVMDKYSANVAEKISKLKAQLKEVAVDKKQKPVAKKKSAKK